MEIGDEVYYVGSPGDHNCVSVHSRVVDKTEDKIYLEISGLPGMSGAGLWNSKGQLVGIMVGWETISGQDAFAIAIIADIVRKEMP